MECITAIRIGFLKFSHKYFMAIYNKFNVTTYLYAEDEMDLSSFFSSQCEDKSVLIWLGGILGVLAMILIVVLFTLWTMDKRIRQKALSRFIVPATLPREQKVKQLEDADQFALPDLLEIIPQDEHIEK